MQRTRKTAASERPGAIADPALLGRLPSAQRATLAVSLGRAGGNRAVQRAVAEAPAGLGGALAGIGSAFGAVTGPIHIKASVGRGGKNRRRDVAAVQMRLTMLGFLGPGGELADAIERYQTDVVGFPHGDGRVDPRGKTLRALNAWRSAPERHKEPETGGRETPVAEPSKPTAESGNGAGPGETVPPADTGTVVSLKNPSVDAILAELRALRAKAEKHHDKHHEETGEDRVALVHGIARIRSQIAALTAEQLNVGKAELESVKARLYREVDADSPYYYQIQNKDILKGEGHAAGKRTCNVTSISMSLEALGKTPVDFKGDSALIANIGAHYPDVLPPGTDLTQLRTPDFLQLVAIYVNFPQGKSGLAQEDPKAFGKEVDKARDTASNLILQNYKFDLFTELFGVKASVHESKYGQTLHGFGSVIRGAKGAKTTEEKMREKVSGKHKKTIEQLTKQLEKAKPGKAHDRKERELKAEQEEETAVEATESKEKMEELLPLETYKQSVIGPVSRSLDQGKQVIVSMFNHFTRLQAIDDEGIVLDDPGNFEHMDWHRTWAEARDIGCFLRWTELE